MHYLFIGNPGAGKSTLLNCLIGQHVFKSGISLGTGLTYQLDKKTIDGKVYMDTPGLEDVQMRKQAAAAITEALKQNGEYKVLFVVTLDSGRIRPVDVALINLVLENAPDISHYAVVFNKLTKPLYERLQQKEEALKILVHVGVAGSRAVQIPFFLPIQRELEDVDDKFKHIPELNQFAASLPPVIIQKQNVTDIPSDNTFDKRTELLENLIQDMRQDKQLMMKQMAELEERLRDLKRNKGGCTIL